MTQADPKHNLTALLIGTGEFSFSEDATSAANAMVRGYRNFGNIAAYSPAIELKRETHFGAYRGVRKQDRNFNIENRIEYKLKCDELTFENMLVYMGGTELSQAQFDANFIDDGSVYLMKVLFPSGAPTSDKIWYEPREATGLLRRMLGFGATIEDAQTLEGDPLVEGTDYVVDLDLGRFRFLTGLETASCTFAINGPGKVYRALTPITKGIRKGYGRLTIFDQNTANKVVLEHLDFSCELIPDSLSEVDGQKVAQLGLTVSVTGDPGTIDVRNDNHN